MAIAATNSTVTVDCNAAVEVCDFEPLYSDSDVTQVYGGTHWTLFWGLMELLMLLEATFLYGLQVYPNLGKESMSPYSTYSFTAWFMWVTYGVACSIWLMNAFFDGQAGKIHWALVVTSRAMVVPPFFQLLLILAIFFSYGSDQQVSLGLKAVTRENDPKYYASMFSFIIATFLDLYVVYFSKVFKGVLQEYQDAKYLEELKLGGCKDLTTGAYKVCSVADDQAKYGEICTNNYTADGEKCVDGKAPF